MITIKPTEKGAGIELYGDYNDLKSLYDTILYLVDDNYIHTQIGDFIFGFSYEIRHAYQRDRLIETFGFDKYDTVNYTGTKILWPHLLIYLALLRYSAGMKSTDKEVQSNLYRIEHEVENCISQSFGQHSHDLINLYPTMDMINTKNYLVQFIDYQSERFVSDFKTKTKRINNLKSILLDISPLSDGYVEFEKHLNKIAKEKNCSPHELQDPFYKWDKFTW
ncbi:MAG: hypothetical protein ABJ387_13715 [Balneola sp.]